MEINFRSIFQDFNPSKFVVYTSLLFFTLLVALKADGIIDCSYVIVFFPLWLWKATAVGGAILGCIAHRKHPPNRNEAGLELEYRGMLLCLVENLFLFVFEVLCCCKMEANPKDLMWLLVFIPLIAVSIISIVVCIWALKREKNFEFELFFGVNVVQFLFVALKLDGLIEWNWVIILVPIWILICVSLIGVLYAIVLAILLIRSLDLLPDHRRQHLFSAMGYTMLVIPVLIFLILLTKRIDGHSDMPYIMVCLPLYISLLWLIFMACGTRGGNQWWFGMRKDFCQWLLEVCPLFQQYGNISYRFPDRNQRNEGNVLTERRNRTIAMKPDMIREPVMKPIMPIISIETPD